MKDEATVKSYEEREKEKWDKINTEKRRAIALGQAINLSEAIAGRAYNGTIEDHINKTFSIVPVVYEKIMLAYGELEI